MYLAASNSVATVTTNASDPRSGQREIAAELAWRVLEELDYGLILVSPQGRIQHANHLARQELARSRFLRGDGDFVCGVSATSSADVLRGIRAAARGRRQLVELRDGNEILPVACVPLVQPLEGESASVLLILARQAGTQNLALTFFARSHGLTPAEEAVLRGLCDGLEVQDIAAANRVCVSTVRTQIRSLRDKTGATSIRVLVQRLAALPPVVPLVPASLAIRTRTAAQCAS